MKTKNTESKIANEKALVELVKNVTASEKELAFATLFGVYKPLILQKLMIGVFYDKETAKDLMMDVFMKVNSKINSYNPDEAAFSTWIYTIARNRLIDFKRSEKYEVLSVEDLDRSGNDSENTTESFSFQIADTSITSTGFDASVKKERATLVREAINAIKNETIREVINLRFIEDISYDEIVLKVNLPLGSIKAYVNRGKEFIESYLLKHSSDFNDDKLRKEKRLWEIRIAKEEAEEAKLKLKLEK